MSDLQDLPALLAALLHPSALVEIAVLLACLGLAWLITARLRLRAQPPPAQAEAASPNPPPPSATSVWFGERGFDGALFPVLALGLAVLARLALRQYLPVAVFHLVVPVLVSLCLIRVSVRVLHATFPKSALVRAAERTLSWGVWLVTVLWLSGLLTPLLAEMEAISWKIGGAPVSLRSLVEGAISTVVILLVVLWLSASLEARLLRADGLHLSVRKIAANAMRAVLLLVGLLTALSAAGIPLGALGVLGGAVGVGIGLGLQKLASNYVSGFVILAERSLRIGDVVKVDNFEGRITDITTRYTVIRAANGRESIVPNELLITQRVENLSFADPQVALTSTVQVAYGTDLDGLTPLLVAAMAAVPRVTPAPAPSVQLSSFAADGLELTCVYWVADIENGQGNVKSDVNRAILRALTSAGAEIPFPQRVVRGLPPASPASPSV